MKYSTYSLVSIIAPLIVLPLVSAIRLIESKSLNPCQANSAFTASLFDVLFTPDNNTLRINADGVSSIQGNVTAMVEVIAYGFTALRQELNPCEEDLDGLCPMNTGQVNIQTNIDVDDDVVKRFPGIAFTVPDLDMQVRIYISSASSGESVACVEAELSNGKTVYQKSIAWVTAVIAGLGLTASAITSGLGHSNTATHVAANALSLFGFFQAQAFIGMTAVSMPPIVQSWTQNFQWSMGIIKVGFMQSIFTWYQRATGGTPTTLLSTLSTTSVHVQKRSLEYLGQTLSVGHALYKREEDHSVTVVKGIERVGFRAGIEQTNIFLTGLTFFLLFCAFVAVLVTLFKLLCELGVKQGWIMSNQFSDFRNGWKVVLKGILFRLVLIGYPQMTVLCLWELVERDSVAEIILGMVVFISMTVALGWAALKVILLAKRSVAMHKNPAYILYADATYLNKWGFLYVQFRATAYYFILVSLGYILLRGFFVAFAQGSGVTQAVALLVIDGTFLIVISILRPWMDKKTNVLNIAIGAVNFLNSILLLFFTSIFGLPGIVTGVMGVVFFFYNAIFALVLLLLVLVASTYAITSKNPDTRYQPMRDDRGSFIKSQNSLHTTELDALGATARGDLKESYGKNRFGEMEDDDDSLSDSRWKEGAAVKVPNTTSADSIARNPPTVDNTYDTAGYPTMTPTPRHDPPSGYGHRDMYTHPDPSSASTFNPGYEAVSSRSLTGSPRPHVGAGYGGGGGYSAQQNTGYDSPYFQSGSMQSGYQQQPPMQQGPQGQHGQHGQQPQYRKANKTSPWQRGAGYE